MSNKKLHDDDDGRVIADMNVPGMPWHAGRVHERTRKKSPEVQTSLQREQIVLTKGEKRAIYKGIMAALLPIVLTFAAVYFLLFLFIDFVWLR